MSFAEIRCSSVVLLQRNGFAYTEISSQFLVAGRESLSLRKTMSWGIMQPIEKLGAFYLGREYDLASRQRLDAPVMYDARDLTTHAVCVGMTGSGKTGLCIDVLEEAALDGVPALIVDPKGDITNLLLAFPELKPENFAPWVNVDDARRKNMSIEEYASHIAEKWRDGLADWDQSPARIRNLVQSADFRVYTPGSDAGLPISILASLAAPKISWEGNEEMLREQISGTASALLGLAGIEADPMRSREHILLANIFETNWRHGQDLDLERLIVAIQNPPVRKLGVFDVDTFFPEKDRFGLAMALNNIMASPSFGSWLQGDPLDISALLRSPSGQPRHSILSIAHLSDAERMFFVTLLLEQTVAWIRQQTGTTSLRALLYIDEVFGYLPPVGNPPSKTPLLTLLKQARAFGLGVMLTTQNPVDLDYKALSNAGTWFIGKLQTEQDKARMLDGLEAAGDAALDRKAIDKLLSALGSRVFLLHNVHQEEPLVFQTRWAMSYLRGPLTRDQIRSLKPAPDPEPAHIKAPSVEIEESPLTTHIPTKQTPEATELVLPEGYTQVQPALPPGLNQVFLPVRLSEDDAASKLSERESRRLDPAGTALVYEPRLLAQARVGFVDRRRKVDEERTFGYLVSPTELGAVIHWGDLEPVDVDSRSLEGKPEPDAIFGQLPTELGKASQYKTVAKDFSEHMYRNQVLEIYHCPELKLYGLAGESERDFLARAQQVVREQRDAEVDKLRRKMRRSLERLEKRLAREQRELVEDKADYESRKREELLSAGETILGMLGVLGRKSKRGLSSAARKRRMTSSAKMDIAESEAEIKQLQSEIEDIRRQMQEDAEAIGDKWEAVLDEIETYPVKPRRADVRVDLVTLAWVPSWEIAFASATGRKAYSRVSAWA